jgi:hypothetical protein
MTIENWAKNPGLPPIEIDVLWRKPLGCEEIVIAKGTLPHLGLPHKGWSGDETVIFRRKQENGNWKITKPLQPEIYSKDLGFRISH